MSDQVCVTITRQDKYRFLVDFGLGLATAVADEPAPVHHGQHDLACVEEQRNRKKTGGESRPDPQYPIPHEHWLLSPPPTDEKEDQKRYPKYQVQSCANLCNRYGDEKSFDRKYQQGRRQHGADNGNRLAFREQQ